MLFALTPQGNKIRASRGSIGHCPFCSNELIPKCGQIIIPHWAHRPGEIDTLCENYEETEWHREWKQSFDPDLVERILKDESGKKRIADVLIPGNPDKVIEFQASSVSVDEIRERSKFHRQNRDIIWVFNAKEPAEHDRIRTTVRRDGISWIWFKPKLSQLLGISKESYTSDDHRGGTRWHYKPAMAAFLDLGEFLLLIKSWWRRESWHSDSTWAGFVAGWGYRWEQTEFLREMGKLAKKPLLVNSDGSE